MKVNFDMNWYLYLTTALFFLGAIVWTSKDWPNTFVKVLLWGLTIWGAFLALVQSGYVIKL